MAVIIILLVLAVLGLVYMRMEAGMVKVREYTLSPGTPSFTFIQISDVHIGRLKVPKEKVKAIIEKVRPDFMVMTGDYIETKGQATPFLEFFKEIKKDIPVYLALGNHDFHAFKKDTEGLIQFMSQLQDTGAVLLHNKSVSMAKDGHTLQLVGIPDVHSPLFAPGKFSSLCTSGPHTNIVFTHNPDAALQVPSDAHIDLMLCGHTHGGQIWMPFDLEFRVMKKDILPKLGMKKGFHKVNHVNLYINSGLGNISLSLRFLSPPEITIFHM